MQNKIFFTHAFFLLYGLATHAYAIDDISLPDRIRQEQRLKELNQQLEEQITQLVPKPVTTQLQDFKTIVVSEEPCVKVKNIDFDRKTLQDPEHYKFHFMLRAIWNHPQKIIGKCIGTQSLRNLVNFAQNELIKKGFITSQVTVAPQDIQQGSLRLGVQIGRLRKIIVEGEQLSLLQLKASLPFKEGDVLNLQQLDQGLENLKRAYTVDIQIVPSNESVQEAKGYSDLIIKLQPQSKINLNFALDQAYTLKVLQVKKDVVTRNRLNGKEFEMSAASKLGVKRNTDRQMITIKTERDGQINIIPDAFGNGGTLVEFKNVQYLTDTQQLRGYGATGKPVTLVVNMNTKISETVKNSILSNKGTIQRFDPIKNTLHSY
ncbi:putative toxin [Acinetobacter pittii]|uniref:putative toxin n=1 Tax=Acinetobacter pittii TaxID=48296 RepID=UPI003008ABCB